MEKREENMYICCVKDGRGIDTGSQNKSFIVLYFILGLTNQFITENGTCFKLFV